MSTDEPHDKPSEVEDETHRKFQEALERKRAKASGGSVVHGPAKSAAPHQSDKRQRTFRRKSGG